MTRITLDAATLAKLNNLEEPMELCNEDGRVLARVRPVLDPALYNLDPQVSEEELRRRMESDERRYTTAEVLAYLQRLADLENS